MNRINSLESLRGLMALWVVVGHTIKHSGFSSADAEIFRALAQPGLAVDVFIILSGFVIFFLLDAKEIGYGKFVTQRWFRLAPIYFFMLLISVVMLRWQTNFIKDFPFSNPSVANSLTIHLDSQAHFPAQLLMHILMIHGAISDALLPSSAYAFLGVAWSISVEWQFYLVAPFIFLLVARRQWHALALVVVALCALRSLNYANEGFIVYQAVYFVIGIGSYYLWKHSDRIAIEASQVELLALIAMCVVYFLSVRYLSAAIWLLTLSCIIAERRNQFTPLQRLTSNILNLRPLQWLGKISYSIYLVHMFVFYSLASLVLQFMPGVSQRDLLLVLLPAVPFATIALSYLTFRCIEQPGIALGKRLSRSSWQCAR